MYVPKYLYFFFFSLKLRLLSDRLREALFSPMIVALLGKSDFLLPCLDRSARLPVRASAAARKVVRRFVFGDPAGEVGADAAPDLTISALEPILRIELKMGDFVRSSPFASLSAAFDDVFDADVDNESL